MAHRLAPEAAAARDEIWYGLAMASGNEGIADRVVENVTNCCALHAAYPHMGRKRDSPGPGRRLFAAGDRVILYRIEAQDVLILHILHRRRDIAGLLRHDH